MRSHKPHLISFSILSLFCSKQTTTTYIIFRVNSPRKVLLQVYVELGVLIAVTAKGTIFWDVTPCSLQSHIHRLHCDLVKLLVFVSLTIIVVIRWVKSFKPLTGLQIATSSL
jgi:hypothetical protein